ncbi:YPDG domain-containing protein, partial [Streptococcus himalayensis]
MKNNKKNKFDWYSLNQRFSVRKYHFGAASVLLGTVMTLGLANTAAADNVEESTVPTSEVALVSEERENLATPAVEAATSSSAVVEEKAVETAAIDLSAEKAAAKAVVENLANLTASQKAQFLADISNATSESAIQEIVAFATQADANTKIASETKNNEKAVEAKSSKEKVAESAAAFEEVTAPVVLETAKEESTTKAAPAEEKTVSLDDTKLSAATSVNDFAALTDQHKVAYVKRIQSAVTPEEIAAIVREAAERNRKRAAAFPTQGEPIPTGTGIRKVSSQLYTDAVKEIKALENLTDIEKRYYTAELTKLTKGVINRDNQANDILAKARAHNTLVAKNRGTSEADAIENTVAPNEDSSVSGSVRLKFGGGINDHGDNYTRALPGVKVYAQWFEKNGYASPIYTSTSNEDGSFGIGMADFIGADGKLYHFDADAALPEGEKWRIWSINPDNNKYTLLYSFGDEQIAPEGIVKDITAGANQSLPNDNLTDAKILYAYKTDDVWRQDAKPTEAVITEGGYVKGSIYWNNNSPAGNQITVDLASRENKFDLGIPGVKVYASYLSDYAVAQLNDAEVLKNFIDAGSEWQPSVNKDKSSNIRGAKWTQANEDKLRAYILQQVKADRAKWVAETVSTTTTGDGDFALQFNGTFGWKWNNPGFDGLINARDTVLRNEANVTNTITGETKKGTEWNGVLAPNPSYGSWTSDGGDSKLDLSKASKHINTDWVFVTTEEKEGISFYTPFYGDVPKGGTGGKFDLQGIGTRWDTVIQDGDVINNDSVTNVYFAAVNDNLTFDIYNYDSFKNVAHPGETASTKTAGLAPNHGETYKIIWKDENGKVVQESDPLQVNPDGTLPESSFMVPSDLKKTTIYFAELYALGKDGALPNYPIQKDSFTAVYRELPKYEDTYSDLGVKKASAAPTFDIEHTPDVEKNPAPKGATFDFVSADGSDTAPAGFAIDSKTGVITWNNPTEDTTVDVEVTYADGTTATTTAKFFINKPDKDKYTPAYEDTEVKAGQSATSAVPTFTNTEGAPATPAATVTYKLGDTSGLPAGVTATIDASTGAVTVTTPEGLAAGTEITVPVTVTYNDQTEDTATVKFTVTESDKDKYTPAYADTEAKAGKAATTKAPTFTDKEGAPATPTVTKYELGEEPPVGASVDPTTGVVTMPIGDSAGPGTVFTVPVKVTYEDGSSEEVKAKISVVASDNDKYTPAYEDTSAKAGATATSKAPTFTENGGTEATPTGVKYELGDNAPADAQIDPNTGVVTLPIPEGTAPGTAYTVPVKVVYEDGSKDDAAVKVTVADSDKDKYTPSYSDASGKPGEAVTTKAPTFSPELPADAKKPTYTISTDQPAGTTPLPAGTTATVDGDGKVSVTVPSDATPGTEYTIPVEVTYGDGSKEVVPVKVTVAEPDKDTTKPTIEAIGDQTVVEFNAITPITVKATDDSGKAPTVTVDGLPTGVTFDPTTGVISGTPTVADWGTDEEKPFTVTVTATDEAGNKTTETFDIKVQRDTDKDGMPDVTDPDDDNDGFSDEDEKTAKTDPKDPTSKPTVTTDADKYTPSYSDASGKPGEAVTTKAPTFSPELPADAKKPTYTISTEQPAGTTPLPAGTTATVDGDGKVSVTVPSDATPGTEYTIPVEVTYGDGSKEVVPVKVTVAEPDKDTTKPTIEAIGDQTVVEFNAITPITVKATDDSGKAPTVTVDGLPTGVTFDPTTGVISGTPTVADWGTDEEKPFTVTVTATDEAGNKTTETFDIKVQRDTDKDGMPDVTDPDDDNDGFSDEDEKTAKTDPKDPTSKPTVTTDADKYTPSYSDASGKPGEAVTTEAPSFSPELPADAKKPTYTISTEQPAGTTPLPAGTTATVDGDGKVSVTVPSDAAPGTEYTIPVEVTYGDGSKEIVPVKVTVAEPDKDTTKPTIEAIGDQTVVEGKAITPITVKATDDSGKAPTVTVDGLPTGVTFDPTTGVISGTPTVADWGTDEEKPFTVTVTATDEAGNKTTETFDIKVQRDTDGDGMPDVTDPDDDNDGFSDEDEKKAGTDPKDPNSKPTVTTDADKNDPKAKEQTVGLNETPKAEDSIENLKDLPAGTTVSFKDPVDTSTEGEKNATVVVTYPDGSSETVPVKIVVKDKRTDADKNDPKAKEQTVGLNETPKAEDSI